MDKKEKKDEPKIVYSINRKLKKAMGDYRIIEDGDHILIGLSGGKDSLALVELLGERMKVFVPRFRVTAAHISVENIGYQSDMEYLNAHCHKHGIELIHRTIRFEEGDEKKSVCFLCSWNRRKALFEIAKATGCNKIALGHHMDDIIETLLLNMIYQGSIQTMPPMLKMDKFDMTIIRPLALVTEKEMSELAQHRNYRKQIKNCPFEKDSSRSEAKKLISELEKWNPQVRQSIWASMENIDLNYLPHKK